MVQRADKGITRTSGMNTWRAGCAESRTSGSEGGPGKPTSRKADRAPWSDPYTGMMDLSSWPDGMRYTALATNQEAGQLADLEVRHRLRARCEDRIRNAKDTGLANLPLHAFASNTLWCHLVMLAAELMACSCRAL